MTTSKREIADFYKNSKSYFDKIQKEKKKLKEGRIKILFEKVKKGDKYIDIGCGPGLIASEVAKKTGAVTFGMDISPHAINIAKSNSPSSKFIVGDVEKIPFGKNEFDVVSSFEVLEHLDSPEKCLREMIRICKRNGYVVLSIPSWFIGVKKRRLWIFNLFVLPFMLLHHYLISFITRGLYVLRLKPNLNLKDWQKNPLSRMADLDACSWISLRSLEKFLEKQDMKIEFFNSYQFLEDMFNLRASSFKNDLVLTLIKIFRKIPILKYFGSGVFVIARKK